MNEDTEKEEPEDNRYCFVCERRAPGWLQFKEAGEVKLRVCYECLGIGIRWIVKQGREDLEKQEASH